MPQGSAPPILQPDCGAPAASLIVRVVAPAAGVAATVVKSGRFVPPAPAMTRRWFFLKNFHAPVGSDVIDFEPEVEVPVVKPKSSATPGVSLFAAKYAEPSGSAGMQIDSAEASALASVNGVPLVAFGAAAIRPVGFVIGTPSTIVTYG